MLNLNFGLEPTRTLLDTDTPIMDYARITTILKGYITRLYSQINNLFSMEFTMGKVFATLSMAGVLFSIYKRDKKDIILLNTLSGLFCGSTFTSIWIT